MAADPGSFRDPSSRVFLDGDRIVRALDATAATDFDALESSALYRDAIAAGRLVGTQRLDAVPSDAPGGTWVAALEHDRVPTISYAYEWTFAMLRDAALLTLDLTLAAIDEGMITKDATPYNVQFVGARPVFIDLGSFERLTKGEPWFGYRQFCELFLNPLLLQARRDLPFQPLLRGSIHGITPGQTVDALRLRDRMKPSVFTNVSLHARLERRYAGGETDVRSDVKKAGFGPAIIRAQVAKLRKLVASLEWKASSSTWSDYSDRAHYADDDLQAKTDFVRDVAAQRPRTQVLDLGANDGYFSDLVVEHADTVVAVDSDALVIDRLYCRLRERSERKIVPLVLDLVDPSGGIGWRNRERPAFVDRVRPDLVLCLAVVHHLAITNTVPLEEVAAWLHDFGAEVVVEFPTRDDPMVKRLLQAKKDRSFERYDQAIFEAALADRFDTRARIELPSGTRTLYHLTPVRLQSSPAAAVRVERDAR
jgi:hypothetical protein